MVPFQSGQEKPSAEVIFELRPSGSDGRNHIDIWTREFQADSTVSACQEVEACIFVFQEQEEASVAGGKLKAGRDMG